LKKKLAITALLFVLSGCQQASQNSNAANSSSSAEKAVSKSTTTKDSTSSLVSSTNTTQSKEEQSMTNVPGSLIQSVSANNMAKVTEILKSSPNLIDEVNANGETPLLIAVHNNQIDLAKLLIDAGADVNKQDAKKDSAYLYAGAEGRTEI
jgi:ankyrin repeat protein